jgi:hypothetical protein
MSHPSSNYVRYLLVKGLAEGKIVDAKTLAKARAANPRGLKCDEDEALEFFCGEVIRDLITLQLPPLLGEWELERYLNQVKLPRSFQFWNPNHGSSAEFMRDQGIYEMWAPTASDKRLFDMLSLKPVVDTVKLLIMGRVNVVEIPDWVRQKHKVDIDPETLRLFKHYFWDTDIASYDEWSVYLRSSASKHHLLSAYAGSPAQALYRAGFNPRIDGKRALNDVQRSIHFRLEATRSMPDNAETASIISRLAKELASIHQVLYGEGAGLEEVLRKFQQLRMANKDPGVVDIRKLAPHGNFSNSGVKDKEKKHEVN